MLNDRNIDLIDEGIDVALPSARWLIRPCRRGRSACAAAVGGEPSLSHAPRHAANAGATWWATRPSSAPCAATPKWPFAGARRGAAPRLEGRLRVDDVETRLRAARQGAASSSSCRTRWPTSWRPAGWCACCRPGNGRRCPSTSSPRAGPTARPRSMRSSTSRPGVSRPCRCYPTASHEERGDRQGLNDGGGSEHRCRLRGRERAQRAERGRRKGDRAPARRRR